MVNGQAPFLGRSANGTETKVTPPETRAPTSIDAMTIHGLTKQPALVLNAKPSENKGARSWRRAKTAHAAEYLVRNMADHRIADAITIPKDCTLQPSSLSTSSTLAQYSELLPQTTCPCSSSRKHLCT